MNSEALSKYIEKEEIVHIILQLLSLLSDLIYNFNIVLNWHFKNSEENKTFFTFLKSYKFELWEKVQKNVSVILKNLNLTNLQTDEFLQAYHSINMVKIFYYILKNII
jgi:hypothetical protein